MTFGISKHVNEFYIWKQPQNDDSGSLAEYLSNNGEWCVKMSARIGEYGGTYFDTHDEAMRCASRYKVQIPEVANSTM